MFSNILILTIFLFFIKLLTVLTAHIENHFSNPCKLCECYIEYTDRDISVLSIPYRVAKNSYNTTEDRCLATCQNDYKCQIAVFGFIGGRDIFTCELYDHINLENPIYAPYTNIYIKRKAPCTKPAHRFIPIWTIKAEQKIIDRKNRYIKFYSLKKFN